MMRQLTERDRDLILRYLQDEPNENIFLIGDIEKIGFDTDYQQVYATFEDNTITSVFLRYRDNGVFYTKGQHTIEPFLDVINNTTFHHFSCKESLVSQVVPYLPGFEARIMYFCACQKQQSKIPVHEDVKVMTTKEEAALIYDLLAQITEFSSIANQDKETFVSNKLTNRKAGMGITNFIKKNGIVVATAATTAETTQAAMVVAVATHPNYRNNGYATMVVEDLIRRYQANGKSLCLFYDNPKAGSIYHRIGFADIGKWAMIEEISQ
jgi:predicted GNAT family acetyltransferase